MEKFTVEIKKDAQGKYNYILYSKDGKIVPFNLLSSKQFTQYIHSEKIESFMKENDIVSSKLEIEVLKK
jgi:hypothetical protein